MTKELLESTLKLVQRKDPWVERHYFIYFGIVLIANLLVRIFDEKLTAYLPQDSLTYYACICIFVFTFSFTIGYLGSPLSPEDLAAFSLAIGISAGIMRNRSHKTIQSEYT